MWKIRWCIGPNKTVHEPSKERKVGPVVANWLPAGWLTVWETSPCTPVMASLGTAHGGFNRLFLVSIACLMQFVHPTCTQHAHERFGGETSPTSPKRKGLLKQTQAHWRMHWSHPYRSEIWQAPHFCPPWTADPQFILGLNKGKSFNHSQPRLKRANVNRQSPGFPGRCVVTLGGLMTYDKFPWLYRRYDVLSMIYPKLKLWFMISPKPTIALWFSLGDIINSY